MDLLYYERLNLPNSEGTEDFAGEQNAKALERFKIGINPMQTKKFSFKWAGYEEKGKSFKDKLAKTTVTITF